MALTDSQSDPDLDRTYTDLLWRIVFALRALYQNIYGVLCWQFYPVLDLSQVLMSLLYQSMLSASSSKHLKDQLALYLLHLLIHHMTYQHHHQLGWTADLYWIPSRLRCPQHTVTSITNTNWCLIVWQTTSLLDTATAVTSASTASAPCIHDIWPVRSKHIWFWRGRVSEYDQEFTRNSSTRYASDL